MAVSYLLLETGDKITLEDGSGSLLLELSISLSDISKLDLEKMAAVDSIDFGNFYTIDSINLGNFITVDSLNLDRFTVKTDV